VSEACQPNPHSKKDRRRQRKKERQNKLAFKEAVVCGNTSYDESPPRGEEKRNKRTSSRFDSDSGASSCD
jgi:hypothetical protein